MKWQGLVGILLLIYATSVAALAVKKPKSFWEMGKIKFFREKMGEKGTMIFFFVFAAVALGFGFYLLAIA